MSDAKTFFGVSVAGEPMVTKCLQGYNCCVFTYGQTGSGKTFTMWGESRDPSQPEVMPEQVTHAAEKSAETEGGQAHCKTFEVFVTLAR